MEASEAQELERFLCQRWACRNCGNTLNRDVAERRLVAILQRMSRSYQTQDLVCKNSSKAAAQLRVDGLTGSVLELAQV